MLKFKGTPSELKAFISKLVEDYGAKTTIKEITQMLEARKNACM